MATNSLPALHLPASPGFFVHGEEFDIAVDSVRRYIDRFTGRLFDRLASSSPQDEFSPADIVAVEMLSVRVPPTTTAWLLSDGGAGCTSLLRLVPANTPLWDPVVPIERASPLWKLWDLLKTDGGLGGSVVRSKLLAAKRPHLVPVYDQHVARALGVSISGYWEFWRGALASNSGEHLRARVQEVGEAAGTWPAMSILRLLDVIIWMRVHGRGPS